MLLYCGDVDLGSEPHSRQLLQECITYTMTAICPVMGVIRVFSARPAHLTCCIIESDCASESLQEQLQHADRGRQHPPGFQCHNTTLMKTAGESVCITPGGY